MNESLNLELRKVLIELMVGADDPIVDTEETITAVWSEILQDMEEMMKPKRPELRLVMGGKASEASADAEFRYSGTGPQ